MGNPLVQPDPGLFLWTILTFLVLLTLLAKFAWKPLLAMLDKRQETIRQSLEEAARARTEFERLQRESRDFLTKAKVEAQGIIAAGQTQSEKVRAEILQDAQAKARAIMENAEKQILAEKEKALVDLRAEVKKEVADLSAMIASKLIRKHITPADDWALIDDSIKQIRPH